MKQITYTNEKKKINEIRNEIKTLFSTKKKYVQLDT